jgi:pyruvate-ferredoxin/flavodoxin oxidoreductase
VQKQIIDKKLKFYVIDAMKIAAEKGMGSRINVIMQTAFFKISGVLPETDAIALIKGAIEKTYGKKGKDIVEKNISTIDAALDGVQQVVYPAAVTAKTHVLPPVPESAPKFVKEVIGEIIAGRGEKLPTSKIPDDGTWPTATTQYEKRNIAEYIPVWDPAVCIQCGNCSVVCPHAVIRLKAYDPKYKDKAPAAFKSVDAKGKEFAGMRFTIQIAPEDCTGCAVCVNICPAKNKANPEKKAINMEPQAPLRDQEAANWEYFLSIPNTDTKLLNLGNTKGTQLLQPLFEFSGACAGCGETPYVKLVSQLFGDRAVIANATGCSSIYGGNLPTTPYCKRPDGRGPAWSNSLFEDAAELGLGMRLASDKHTEFAKELADRALSDSSFSGCAALLKQIKENPQKTQEEIENQRSYIADLKAKLGGNSSPLAKELLSLADNLIRRSVWILGGDGWAYDIGFGGLDHVIASGKNVNILVMDTEVYSNTGGQMSKATPIGAIAKFAAGGKPIRKKDLGMIAMSYGYVYVARVSMGYNAVQVIKSLLEAEAYDGPSIIIAYSHCIAHGIDMTRGMEQQKAAVTSGIWPLYRYNPDLSSQGKNPFQLDSREPATDPADYMYNEIRYRSLKQAKPEQAQVFLEKARENAASQYKAYKYLADRPF